MTPLKCQQCGKLVSVHDTISVDGDRIVHLDCRRPAHLSHEERVLLFRYCFDHTVADCATCGKSYRQQELASDLIHDRSQLCPTCRENLTESVRRHLYGCSMLPENVRQRAREARDAALRLIKRSQEVASPLMQELRTALAALREAMGR